MEGDVTESSIKFESILPLLEEPKRPKCPKCGSYHVTSKGKQWQCQDCPRTWMKYLAEKG